MEYRQTDSALGKSVGKLGKTHFKFSQSLSGINRHLLRRQIRHVIDEEHPVASSKMGNE